MHTFSNYVFLIIISFGLFFNDLSWNSILGCVKRGSLGERRSERKRKSEREGNSEIEKRIEGEMKSEIEIKSEGEIMRE